MSTLFCLLLGFHSLTASEIVMKHMKEPETCKLCHQAQNNQRLVMLDGSSVERADSSRLCGQCHGEKFSDWKEGMHGKSTGSWTSTKKRVTCTVCHDPHSPKFAVMKAYPAPKHPKRVVIKKEEVHHE